MTPFAIALCAALCFPAPLNHFRCADDLDHVIFEGAVNDANGNAVAGAHVFVKHAASSNERMTLTNQEGRYRFSSLVPGEYALRVEATNFQTITIEKINAIAGANIRRDFRLVPAGVTEQTTITADVNSTLPDGID